MKIKKLTYISKFFVREIYIKDRSPVTHNFFNKKRVYVMDIR